MFCCCTVNLSAARVLKDSVGRIHAKKNAGPVMEGSNYELLVITSICEKTDSKGCKENHSLS